MAEEKGVLVLGEISEGQLSSTVAELLAVGRNLGGELGEQVTLALSGADLGALPQEGIVLGADAVYAVTDPLLEEFQVDAHLAALEKLCQETSPRVILLAKTQMGRELGPRLAFRLDTGVLQDCMELALSEGKLVGLRAVYGGSAMAAVACTGAPMMAILHPKTAEPLPRDESRTGEVVGFAPHLDPAVVRNRLIDRVREAQEGIRMEDAAVVVSGGRGLGGPEAFEHIRELADLLGGAWGTTRATVDMGWAPYAHQIGLTGKSISPDLYIAVAISGASQHMSGCSAARAVVAINKDPEANIFKEARFGVVGDWSKVLTAFTQQVRELLE